MSAEERREAVVRAALTEFARGGYNGTSTEAIARRVGVSQPYLFRLFPNKQEIFLAACERCSDDLVSAFRVAAEGLEGEEALHAMAGAYQRGIAEKPERLLMQMQMYAAAGSATASGDVAFSERLRRSWVAIWDAVAEALGAPDDEVAQFMAYGMLVNTMVSLGFPPGHRVWQAVYESAQPAQGQQEPQEPQRPQGACAGAPAPGEPSAEAAGERRPAGGKPAG